MPKGELSIAKDTESWLFFDNLKKKQNNSMIIVKGSTESSQEKTSDF